METEILAQTHPGTQVETPKKLLAKTGNKDWLLLVLVQAFAFVLQFVLGLLIGLFYALQHKKPDMLSLQNTLSNPAITMLPTFAAELITFMIARKLLKQKICGHFRKPVVSAKFLSAGCIAAVILIAFITAAIVLVVINRKKIEFALLLHSFLFYLI